MKRRTCELQAVAATLFFLLSSNSSSNHHTFEVVLHEALEVWKEVPFSKLGRQLEPASAKSWACYEFWGH